MRLFKVLLTAGAMVMAVYPYTTVDGSCGKGYDHLLVQSDCMSELQYYTLVGQYIKLPRPPHNNPVVFRATPCAVSLQAKGYADDYILYQQVVDMIQQVFGTCRGQAGGILVASRKKGAPKTGTVELKIGH